MLTGSGVTVVQVAARPAGLTPVMHSVDLPVTPSNPRSEISDFAGSQLPPVIWNENRVHPLFDKLVEHGLVKMRGPVVGV
jgi:hypothetical protein